MGERRVISRERRGRGFVYRVKGRRVRGASELSRIRRLAVPPAWTDVEIAISPSAKVLARGRDAEGRTQRIYNPAFRRRQEKRKFERLPRFGGALPGLRARIERDLARRGQGRSRVTACALRLIDSELLRVGNPASAERRGSYGVTTLRLEHVTLTRRTVKLDFIGKSGKRQLTTVRDPQMARLLARLAEAPEPQVFHYLRDDDSVRRLRSKDVNTYLARHLGEEFTAKDFRTWGATVVVANTLLGMPPTALETPTTRAAALREAVAAAAERLGNTPAVARSSYVDPRVLSSIDRPGVLGQVNAARSRMRGRKHFTVDEQATLALLEAMDRQ